MEAKWFAAHVAYTMSKFGMSMCVLGMAEELEGRQGIAANALWPKSVIATAALAMLGDVPLLLHPEIANVNIGRNVNACQVANVKGTIGIRKR